MKKLNISLLVAVIALSFGASNLAVSHASTMDTADLSYVSSISNINETKYNNEGNISNGSILRIKDDSPVYALKDGRFVLTNRVTSSGTDWSVGSTVETSAKYQYFQISNNEFVKNGINIDLIQFSTLFQTQS
ncbi:hypothetical protein [Companilactobacillus mishanensis]|uniref:Surface layer protein A domain-containing protein n=1 Tax=Companilactobacillus mishanensis TaxID=2486008 RepID=A0ABW9P4Q0_9LACO|nr:hypothetical protein [Companilactobacillus mishanensis]MQS44218.1 hypothetical protein [Companilactobacillus mishanensis]